MIKKLLSYSMFIFILLVCISHTQNFTACEQNLTDSLSLSDSSPTIIHNEFNNQDLANMLFPSYTTPKLDDNNSNNSEIINNPKSESKHVSFAEVDSEQSENIATPPALINDKDEVVIYIYCEDQLNYFINNVSQEFKQSVTKVVISMALAELPQSCFANCVSLDTVVFMNKVMCIGNNAFAGCTNLKVLDLTAARPLVIGKCAFSRCKSLSTILFSNNTILIGNGAFQSCESLSNICLPENITYVGDCAFSDCTSLKRVMFPRNMQTIFPGGTLYNYLLQKWSFKPEPSLGKFAFSNCSSLESICLPNNLNHIGIGCFQNCSSLKSIKIPLSVSCINDDTFMGCTSLSQIFLHNGIVYIGESAFESCWSINEIIVPLNVSSIKYRTFYDCKSLTELYMPFYISYIEKEAIDGCDIKNIHVYNKEQLSETSLDPYNLYNALENYFKYSSIEKLPQID